MLLGAALGPKLARAGAEGADLASALPKAGAAIDEVQAGAKATEEAGALGASQGLGAE